jgi:hypothetical protein
MPTIGLAQEVTALLKGQHKDAKDSTEKKPSEG